VREGADVDPTSVFVIEDHPVMREGVKMLLDATGDVRVVGSSATASGALDELARTSPAVILLDLDLGSEDGLQALPSIAGASPESRVLIFTALRDRARDEAALAAGARGLVLKDASAEQLVRAIRVVATGGLWFDPRVLQSPAPRKDARRPASPSPLAGLTARERDIVELVVQGLKNEEVARRLGISEKTVRNHLTGVFDKLQVTDRLQLLVFAYQHGIARVRR
jgi:DNA-binding NarL/FixJ family response regulator